MSYYLLHALNSTEFEELVTQVCHELLGIGASRFASGPDGGRDAYFEGTAQRYPSAREPWSGKFVIQAKHTELVDASCADSDFERILLKGSKDKKSEAEKVKERRKQGKCDCYLMFTNRRLPALREEKLVEEFRKKTGVHHVAIVGRELISTYLDEAPQIARHFKLQYSEKRPHWNVPNRNEYFTGREEALTALEERLEAAGTAALTQAITGLGGVGKTQIAVEFCHRHRERYEGGVYWADASSVEALETSYAGFAVDRRLAEKDDPVGEASAQFLRLLSEVAGWLLVLDNADAPEEVRHLRPTSATGHVIVTTRAQVPDLGRDPLSVDVLPLDQATDLLLDRSGRGPEERDVATDLADALGCLPLALEQAGAYMAHARVSVADYFASFRRRRLDLVEEMAPKQGEYHATVATTWDMSFHKVQEASQAASEALWACAFLAPEGIPLELFVSTGDRLGPALGTLAEEVAEDPLAANRQVVEPLTRYSLVTFAGHDGGRLSIHRLVREVIRARLASEGHWSDAFERVHQALYACFPQDPASPASWPSCAVWFPHVQSGLALWRDSSETWDPTSLWHRTGHYALAGGLAKGARELFAEILSVRGRVLGEEHPDTLSSMSNLATTLRDLGDAAGARELHEEALSVYRRVLGEEHPDTHNSMNNLAATLSELGDAAGARELLEETLSVRRRMLGEEHPETLMAMNNLAEILRDLGDAAGARELHEETLSVFRRVLGEEHPHTLRSMNNLAEILRDLGDAAGARELHEETLSVFRRVLGEEHPGTLHSMNNLALTLWNLGDASGARELHEETLSVRRRVLGEEHPHTLHSMNNLALTLRDLGDASGARELHEEVLSVYRRVLGEEHPHTLNAICNLCFLLAETEGMEVDHQLVEELLAGVRKLPKKTPIRVAAEARWGDPS